MGTSRIGFPVGSLRPFRASDFCCLPNPRAAVRFALGYPLAPRWGIKPSGKRHREWPSIRGQSPRFWSIWPRNRVRRTRAHHDREAKSMWFSNSPRTLVKHRKVRFLSSPLKNPGFPKVLRISCQLLWPSVAPMQLGAWRRAALAIRVALSKSSRFSSRTSRQNTGVLHGSVWYRSTPVGADSNYPCDLLQPGDGAYHPTH
jgi:hypothetical protein